MGILRRPVVKANKPKPEHGDCIKSFSAAVSVCMPLWSGHACGSLCQDQVKSRSSQAACAHVGRGPRK